MVTKRRKQTPKNILNKRNYTKIKNILKKYNETQLVSNNTDLQRIFYELESKMFLPNAIIETHIRNHEWREFDDYCAKNIGIDNFWSIFQNIFYLAPEIDNTSLQIALGIQQVYWSVDSENEFQTRLTRNLKNSADDSYSLYYDTVKFKYFYEIDNTNQHNILSELSDALKLDYHLLSEHLQNTIWYEVSGRRDELGVFNPFVTGKYYGIPASYDFSTLTCTHQPTIIFGHMKSSSLVNYIIKNNKRPYVGHLPNSKSNLYNYDEVEAGILPNWYHDLFHQKNGYECDIENTIRHVLEFDNGSTYAQLFGNKPVRDIKREDWLTVPIQTTLNNEKLSLELTDRGDIFEYYVKKGGKRRTKKKKI